jgi:hypothetical protein
VNAAGSLVRTRGLALLAAALTVAGGLAVRSVLDGFWAKYLGVGLWAVCVYALVVAAAPRLKPGRAALVALAISWAVEFFQLTPIPAKLASVHPWFRLVFGEVFGWGDLPAYAAGVLIAALVHRATRSRG